MVLWSLLICFFKIKKRGGRFMAEGGRATGVRKAVGGNEYLGEEVKNILWEKMKNKKSS